MQYNYFRYPNDKLPNYGSVLYFAYRKLSNHKKETLYLLDQLKSQFISCTELYDNIEVANQKMNWWIKEINNIKSLKHISSPQIKQLTEIFDTELLYKSLISDIYTAIDNSSNIERNFTTHISDSFLGIETIKALYLNNFKAIDEQKIKQININNEIARHIFCMPKHFYNQIVFDSEISPNMDNEKFKEIAYQWLTNYKKVKYNKNINPLIKINNIHNKMLKKYVSSIDTPFKETLDFSPLNLLIYSM